MDLLHKGFDALDLAFMAHLPTEQAKLFERAKSEATATGKDTQVQISGVGFTVGPTGGRGGYAFRATTGSAGEIWFFKRYSRSDPWGIRVTVSAAQCAMIGLAGVRERLEKTLEKLNIPVSKGSESISRVDYALDFLIPKFELVANQFVMHSNMTRIRHAEFEVQEFREAAKSHRTQTVMIGKNPGRQVVVYDKRTEVLKNRKSHWPEIWKIRRAEQGKPPLDLSDAESSAVWRVELRAYKRHLKEDWKVSSWGTLQQKLPSIFESLLADIRYTSPTADRQRTRWPNHRLWDRVTEEVRDGLLSARSFASEVHVRELHELELQRMLREQTFGCLIALAAIKKTPPDQLQSFFAQQNDDFAKLLRDYPKQAAAKLAKARAKYG